MVKKIFLWSGPRNISTALMYSFAQRQNCKVVDEPLYAHYLSKTDAKNYHPGSKDVLNTQENNGGKVIENLLNFNEKPVLFVKNMTHHLVNLNFDFLNKVESVILTRDPKEMLPSYIKQIKKPKMVDVGYKAQLNLVRILQSKNKKIIVLNAKNVLQNPEKYLSLLCEKLNINFDENMLTWQKGAIIEDGVWAKYWYKNVHNSTGFLKYKTKNEVIPNEYKLYCTIAKKFIHNF